MLTLQETGAVEASPKWADKVSPASRPPTTSDVPLFGKKVFADVIKMRSFWTGGPKSKDCALREDTRAERQRRERRGRKVRTLRTPATSEARREAWDGDSHQGIWKAAALPMP